MASPLLGIAAVNSLLFTAYSVSRRIVSPFPDLSIPQVGLAGAMAGAVNATLASPGEYLFPITCQRTIATLFFWFYNFNQTTDLITS
jgi:solute carrier family 25 (mitochondrial carnitine/acylcarnitine transporter), member 20/29